MFYTNSTFIGIDPTAGEKPFVYAALDHELRLLALGHGSIDDILGFRCRAAPGIGWGMRPTAAQPGCDGPP